MMIWTENIADDQHSGQRETENCGWGTENILLAGSSVTCAYE